MTATVRDSFAAKFGEEQAAAIMAAAEGHKNGVHDNQGSDPFKWAIAICIGFECFTEESYRSHHGITAPVDEVVAWVKSDCELGSHDGDVDYLAVMAGAYAPYLPAESVQS